MTLSVVQNAFDKHPVWHALSWADVRTALSVYTPATDNVKTHQPLYSPAQFNGQGKKHEHVTAIHFGVLDFDKATPEQVSAAQQAALPYAALMYTTWSHPEASAQGLVNARLIVPFARACTSAEWPRVWAYLRACFGGSADAACSDPNRCYFVPCMPPGQEAFGAVWLSPGSGTWNPDDAPPLATLPASASAPRLEGNDPADEIAVRRLASKLEKSKDATVRRQGMLLRTALEGAPIALPGARNSTLWEIAGVLAAEFPFVNASDMATLFTPSISQMRTPGEQDAGVDVDTFADQIERRQETIRDVIATERARETERTIAAGVDPEAPRLADWRSLLVQTEKGPAATIGNVATVLQYDPRWQGVLAFDALAQATVFWRAPVIAPNMPALNVVSDADTVMITQWLEREHKITCQWRVVSDAIDTVARQQTFNPLHNYLLGLQWDGKPRIDTWLTDYCAAADTHITRIFGAKWLVSAVARAATPGCQVDTALILKGDQGLKKTSLFRVLGGSWFNKIEGDLIDRDVLVKLQGKWIIEVSELEAISRSGVVVVRQFMSETADTYRAPYAKRAESHPRSVVFAGTTNEEYPLQDHAGNRRFWPVDVGKVSVARIEADRDQLWAEAVMRYMLGLESTGKPREYLWWLTTSEERLAEGVQEENREQDAWEYAILQEVKHVEKVRSQDVLNALGIPAARCTVPDFKRIARCMRALGWKASRNTNERFWVRGSRAIPMQERPPANVLPMNPLKKANP